MKDIFAGDVAAKAHEPVEDPGDRFLRRLLQSQRESGFFLFVGPEGTDLEERALWFFKGAVCRNRDSQLNPCGACAVCAAITRRNFPDLVIVRARPDSREIRIADIREVLRWLPIHSYYGKKLLLITPAESMTPESSNALLRSLEEPHDEAVIVLITYREWQLLETLRSRAIRIPFLNPLHRASGDTAMERFFNHRQALCEYWRAEFGSVWETSKSILYGIAASRTPDWAFGLMREFVDRIAREADQKDEVRRSRASKDSDIEGESVEPISRTALWDLYLQVLAAQALDLWRVENGWEPRYLTSEDIRPFTHLQHPNWRGIFCGVHRLRRLLQETNVHPRWMLYAELLRNVRK